MANYLAVRIDRAGIADMSCIAGVGGGVRKLVRTASSGRKIIVIDGCPLACSRACLSQHDLVPDLHIDLSTFDVSKKEHEDFDLWEADEIFELLKGKLMDESYGSSGLFTFIDHS
jgi:uncharacterized metal-binding protein